MGDPAGERREDLKERYLKTFGMLVDMAFSGKPQPFVFCEDLVLELYLEDEELHWRRYEE